VPAEVACRFEVVEHLHHGLLGDPCPGRELGQMGPAPVHQQHRGGVTGGELGRAPVCQSRADLGIDCPKGLQKQPREPLLGHDLILSGSGRIVKHLY